MAKSTFFSGQPVLNQILHLIPRHLVNDLSRKFRADRYYKKFKCLDHLVTMLFCAFHHCTSLRELITGLQVTAHRLPHLGLVCTPRRSTLADANQHRTADFFGALFHELYRYYYGTLPDSLKHSKLHEKLFVIDSTTIALFCDVMKAAGNAKGNGRKKGGMKAHVLMPIKDQVPSFVHLSESSKNDRTFMHMIKLPAHAVLAMDKGYLNYTVMNQWTKDKISWVSRLNEGAFYQVIQEQPVTEQQRARGVRKDTEVILGQPATKSIRPIQRARIVTYYDRSTKRAFKFVTNNFEYSPVTIADIYQQRWQVETLFRRVKHNFQFHNFLGDNENAIKIQMWCSLIADLLITVIKDKVDKARKHKWSFSNIAGMIRLHLTTYINLFQFLINPERAVLQYSKEIAPLQLALYKT